MKTDPMRANPLRPPASPRPARAPSQRGPTGLLLCLLLSACAHLPGQPSAAQDPTCGDPLEFYAVTSQLPESDAAGLLDALRQSPALPCGRLRLALLLSRPGAAYRDDAAAASALQAFLQQPPAGDRAAQNLARLLAEELVERGRLREARDDLQRRLTQAEADNADLRQALSAAQQAPAALRQRLQALQRQLDQLKSIEQVINDKERDAARAPAGSPSPGTEQRP